MIHPPPHKGGYAALTGPPPGAIGAPSALGPFADHGGHGGYGGHGSPSRMKGKGGKSPTLRKGGKGGKPPQTVYSSADQLKGKK